MRHVTDRAEFDGEWNHIERFIYTGKGIHEGAFRIRPYRSYIIQFQEFQVGGFFADVRQLANRLGESEITIATLDPDPVGYFHKNFGRFQMLISDPTDTIDAYIAAINEAPPNGNSADSISTRANYTATFTKSQRWFVFGDWDFDTMAVGVFDPEIESFVKSSFSRGSLLKLHDCVEFYWRWNHIRVDEEFMRNHYNTVM